MRLARPQVSDPERWVGLCRAEARFFEARMDFMRSVDDLEGTLRLGLQVPHQRGTALRLLLILDEGIRRALFDSVLPLAIEAHSDTRLSRDVIASIDGRWRSRVLGPQLSALLDFGGPEEYRGAAELLRQLKSSLLGQVLARAADQPDPDIREVAADFGYAERERTDPEFDAGLEKLLRAAGDPRDRAFRELQLRFSERDREVLNLLLRGQSFTAIAETLDLAPEDVQGIVRRLREILL